MANRNEKESELIMTNPDVSSIEPRCGVVTLFGYGIRVCVDRGHLVLEDGIGADRRRARFARVGHDLNRVVVIGSDGVVSLAALRWLSDQDASFVMLERDGKVLAITGPVRPSDARLRRAQALSGQSGVAVHLARELIDKKIAGQESVARYKLLATGTADTIAHYRAQLNTASSPEAIRQVESQAAGAYWAAWRTLPINFPRKDEPRVPAHWRFFGARVSPLSGSPRLAVNPPNAMLNYLYSILESESRLAAAALGLDPGIGFLHVDAPARDSLACDLMEVVRPEVDSFLLDWITREILKRSWFLEQPNGNCRLMSELAIKLSETALIWRRAVAPLAEWVAATLWSRKGRPDRDFTLPTRLTQRNKREAKSSSAFQPTIRASRRENVCMGCGKTIRAGGKNCADCAISSAKERFVEAARIGRLVAHTPAARAKQSKTQRQHAKARSSWTPSNQPNWLTTEVYCNEIQPLITRISTSAIRAKIGVSRGYASQIRGGYVPHPRHWKALSELGG